MPRIGIFADKEMSQKLDLLLNSANKNLIHVKEKESLEKLDGVVIYLDKQKNLTRVIEWLLFSKSNPSVFIWIVSLSSLDCEQNILFELGANYILTSTDEIAKLPYIIKNTFNRLKNTESDSPKEKNRKLLNEKNQTVLVNKEEKSLTRIEYQMFQELIKNPNNTVNYDTLFKIRNLDFSEKIDRVEKISRVANVIFHLRKKTRASVDFQIETVRSKGYLLRVKNKYLF